MSASGVAVAAERLTKRYGALAAVDDLTFEVPPGQLVAVLGPNGAGKTTTLEMLEGFAAPTSGTARVLGADPRRGGRAWRARIGLVLQSTSLEAELTVRETLALDARLYPAPRPVGEVMNLAGLTDDAQTRVGVLSGGQRRRVDLAIGIIGQPEVLFLDEPTTGLDPEARRRTWHAVQDLYGVRLVAAREAGVLKRWRATPLPRWCYFLGRIVACVIVAAIAGVATVLAAVLLYHTHLSSSAWLGAVAAFVLGGAAWAAAGLATAVAVFRWEPHRPAARRPPRR